MRGAGVVGVCRVSPECLPQERRCAPRLRTWTCSRTTPGRRFSDPREYASHRYFGCTDVTNGRAGLPHKRNDNAAPALNRRLRLSSSAAEVCILSATPGAPRLIRKFLLPGAAALAFGCVAAWPSSGYAQYIDAMHDAEGRCQHGDAAACGEAKNLFAAYCAHLTDNRRTRSRPTV